MVLNAAKGVLARKAAIAAGALCFVASACAIVDGEYRVRGGVRSLDSERAPLTGVTATVPGCAVGSADGMATATTDARGEYSFQRCVYGGMCTLLFFGCPGVPDTTIHFAKPGYKSLSVRLLEKESDTRVSRRRCPSERGCFEINVLLERE
jgi:hypothetical protein